MAVQNWWWNKGSLIWILTVDMVTGGGGTVAAQETIQFCPILEELW